MTNEAQSPEVESTEEDTGRINLGLELTSGTNMAITPVMSGPGKTVFIAEMSHNDETDETNLNFIIHGFPGAENGAEARELLRELVSGFLEVFDTDMLEEALGETIAEQNAADEAGDENDQEEQGE